MAINKGFVFAPEYRRGFGTGHMKRAIDLLAIHTDAKVYVPMSYRDTWRELLSKVPSGQIVSEVTDNTRVIVDSPSIDDEFMEALQNKGPLIGLDSIGPLAACFEYVIDTLPRAKESTKTALSNISDRGFLNLPQRAKNPSRDIKKVLISFGGEDSFYGAFKVTNERIVDQLAPEAQIDLIIGSQYQGPKPEAIHIVPRVPDLSKILDQYDLVITQFGLTAYEALAAGCLVILYNPTHYHQSLSDIEGFVSLPLSPLPRLAHKPHTYIEAAYQKTARFNYQKKDLLDYLGGLKIHEPWSCPACKSTHMRVIDRFAQRSFGVCLDCSMVSMYLCVDQSIEYSEAYFFEAYQKQYGKTYLDDFAHIKGLGATRLKKISRYQRPPGRLIDIGCAYGPFLSAGREAGYEVEGIDISKEAVAYCNDSLGIKARTTNIFTASAQEIYGDRPFDLVTMWYVIEHFKDLHQVLDKVSSIVGEGGIFAFSTPSFAGVSGRFKRHLFLAQSPMDHYTIWNPRRVKKVLSLYGFELLTWYGLSHHPGRFGGLLGKKCMAPVSRLLSRLFKLSDTFEMIVRKKGSRA